MLDWTWYTPDDSCNVGEKVEYKYLDQIRPGSSRIASPQARGEAAICQRRFWEHSTRSEGDLNRQMDYLQYNPVQHGLVERPVDWPWSSFHRFVKTGYYVKEWEADLSQEVLDLEYGE